MSIQSVNPFDTISAQLDTILRELKKSQSGIMSTSSNDKEWGDVNFASKITGYKKSTIYLKVHRKEICFVKRHGRLFFEKTALLNWIETGFTAKISKHK